MAKESTHKLVNKEGVCVFMGSKRQCKKHKTVELEVQQILSFEDAMFLHRLQNCVTN